VFKTKSELVIRKLEKPCVGIEDAVHVAEKLYGIKTQPNKCSQLESYDDANFKVEEETRRRKFVCKFHNGVESRNKAFLDAQNLMALCLTRLGFTVPCPLSSRTESNSKSGPLYVMVTKQNPKTKRKVEHAVRFLSWIEGKTMAEAALTPTLLRRAGSYLARLDKALDNLLEPSEELQSVMSASDSKRPVSEVVRAGLARTHLWDLRNFELVGGKEFIKPLETDEPKLTLLKATLKDFQKKVLPLAETKKLREGVLHGDFNDANIILSTHDKDVAGVIDFGDSTISWRANDPAIALGYIVIALVKADKKDISALNVSNNDEDTIERAVISFLKGYLSEYALSEDEVSVLLLLAQCRIATSATMGW